MKKTDSVHDPQAELEHLLAELMRKKGFTVTQRPKEQPSIDIVALKGDQALLIEVKSLDPSTLLGFDSLAQVLSARKNYRCQKSMKVQPMVVGTFTVSEIVKESAKKAGIELCPIEEISESNLEALCPPIGNYPVTQIARN